MTRKPLVDIIAAVLFLVFTLAAYGAWYHVVGKTSAEALALRSQLEERGAAGDRAAAAKKTIAELSGKEAAVYGHLVSKSDVVSFLETVETTGRRLGAKVEVVSVSDAAGKQNQLQLALRIAGPFDAVTRTIGALEYQKYSATLMNLTLESQGASVGTWEATATFAVGTVPEGIKLPQPAPYVAPPATTTTATSTAVKTP